MLVQTRQGVAAVFIMSALAGACNRDEPEVPPAQTEAQAVQQTAAPTIVTGCLRGGEAANTFVVTTSMTVDDQRPATYQLTGDAGVDLTEHIGKRVEVRGVIREQTQIATRTTPEPAEEKAAGTTGTPTVQTGTQLAIRQLDVTAIKRLDGECEM